MDCEFNVIYDLYDRDKEGNLVCLKKNLKKKLYVTSREDVSAIREVPNSHYKPYKSKCEIYYRPDNTWYTVIGNIKDIKSKIENKRIIVKGFR